MTRQTKKIQKGLILLAVGAATVLGCELVVDFDRTKIPIENTDAGPIDSSIDVSTDVTVTDANNDAADAADEADASDAGDAADAQDAD